MPEGPEQVFESAWAQAVRALSPDMFSIGLCGPGPTQVTYELVVERGVRQPRSTREIGDGLTELVLRTKNPLLIGDFEQEQGFLALSWMAAPLLSGERVLGVISAQCSRQGAFDRRALSFLSVLAAWTVAELEGARHRREARRAAGATAALVRLATLLADGNGRIDPLRSVAEAIPAVLEGVRCTVWSRQGDTSEFNLAWGSDGSKGSETQASLPEYLTALLALAERVDTRNVVVLSNDNRARVGGEEAARLSEGHVVALVPLADEDRLVGVAVVTRPYDGEALAPEDVELLQGVADVVRLFLQAHRREQSDGSTSGVDLEDLKSWMLPTISHEVRTPLSLISTGAELLTGKLQEPDQLRQVAELVGQGASRLTSAVDEIIEYVELKGRAVSLSPRRVEPSVLVGEAISEVTEGPSRDRVTLQSSWPLPAVSVDGDKLKSAVAKLVRNALAFSNEPGKVLVQVSIEFGRLKVKVIDEGVGIPRDEIGRVFKPFYRGEFTQTRNAPGTGLGLTIAREIVHAMGGEIGIESQVNRGTTVSLSVPVDIPRPNGS